MWFYEKEEIRYSPTSSSEILFSLGSVEYRHERANTIKKFLCKPFKT